MNTYQKQFLITVLAGVTTLAVWELYLKPKVLATQQPTQQTGIDFWPFN